MNRNTQQNSDRKMVLAIPKYLSNAGTLTLAGKPYTPADLVKLFQSRIDSADSATAAHAKWLDTVNSDRALTSQTAVPVRALKDFLQSMFADQAGPLGDFGLTPRKVAQKSVATKAHAVAQSKATRSVRGTMGKVQKQAVKGTVPATATDTPATAHAPVAATPATGTPTQGTGSGTAPHTG